MSKFCIIKIKIADTPQYHTRDNAGFTCIREIHPIKTLLSLKKKQTLNLLETC